MDDERMTEPAPVPDPVAPPSPRDPVAAPSVRDHLANERTLLAWIRTALTLIGIGFLIDRLAAQGQATDWTAYAGVVLVLFGGILALAGGYTFIKTRRALTTGTFRPSVVLYVSLVALITVGAFALVVFLLSS